MVRGDHWFRTLVLENEAIREGHFIFTPAYHSRFIVDFARIVQDPEASSKIVSLLFEPFRNEDVTHVLTANQADGFVLAHGVATKFNSRVIRAERRDGVVRMPRHVEFGTNDRILLVDDGLNTGNTMKQLVMTVNDAGATCCGISVCVCRFGGDLTEFGVPVKSVFQLAETYPLSLVRDGCAECDEADELVQRLRDEVDEAERLKLMKRNFELTLESAYVDWRY